MNEAKIVKAQAQKEKAINDLADKNLDEEDDIPRFEGYYKSMSEGKHPFEEEKYKFYDN
jgi:hypothetical protein